MGKKTTVLKTPYLACGMTVELLLALAYRYGCGSGIFLCIRNLGCAGWLAGESAVLGTVVGLLLCILKVCGLAWFWTEVKRVEPSLNNTKRSTDAPFSPLM